MAKKLINGKKYDVVPNTDLGTNVIEPGGGGSSESYIEAPANPSDGDTLVYNAELQTWEAKAPGGGSNVSEAVWGEPVYDRPSPGSGYVHLIVQDYEPGTVINIPEPPELADGWNYSGDLMGGYVTPTVFLEQMVILVPDGLFEYIPEEQFYATSFQIASGIS